MWQVWGFTHESTTGSCVRISWCCSPSVLRLPFRRMGWSSPWCELCWFPRVRNVFLECAENYQHQLGFLQAEVEPLHCEYIRAVSQLWVSVEDLQCAHCPVCSSSNLTFWIEFNVLKCIHTIWARASPTCCTRAYELISWPCPSIWGCSFLNGWMSTASPPVQSPFNVAIMHSGCCMICLGLFERPFEPLWFCGHCVCTALDKEVPEYEDDITADYQSKHKALVCTLCLLFTWTFIVSILLYTIWTELLILWITVLSDKYCKEILIVVV